MDKKKLFIGILLFFILISVVNRITKCSADKNYKPKQITNNSTIAVQPLTTLKGKTTIEIKDLELNFSNIKIADRYIFDRYDSRYIYRLAKRGYKYIVTDVIISSNINDPNLPSVALYAAEGDKLKIIRQLEYNFFSWTDYGRYLGNFHEPKNDFNYTKSVKFSLGGDISEDVIKNNSIYLIIFDNQGFVRMSNKLRNPEIYYDWLGKKSLPRSLIANDFNEKIQLIKKIN